MRETGRDVFGATEVSRNIVAFQLLAADVLVATSDAEMDASKGRAPARLEELLARWKEQLQATASGWPAYLSSLGCSAAYVERVAKDEDGWVRSSVARAAAKGTKYGHGGGRGAGKGGGGGGGRWHGGGGGRGDRGARGGGGWRGGRR